MPEAFICDGMRTPIGRYGGGLAKVRTDDLAAVPIKALMKRHPERRLDARSTRCVYGCANQAGEDNRNVARMALLLAGLPDTDPGDDRQPAVRLGAERSRRRGAGDPRRRDRLRHRRRRRIDDARAAGHGQGAGGVPAKRDGRGHHHRLALHQSADEEAVRRRRHAGDRGERRRGLPGRAQGPGRASRCARSSAPPRRRPPAISPKRSSR